MNTHSESIYSTSDTPNHDLLHHMITAQAEAHPDRIAVIAADGRLSYADLNRRANGLATHLAVLGIGPEKTVGISLSPGIMTPVAVLAVLKAGGVYVPMAPDLPTDRIAFMLADCRAALLLTQRKDAPPIDSPSVQVICLDDVPGDPIKSAESTQAPPVVVQPHHAAYILYTSGSTGHPKGVVIEHAAVSHYLTWCRDRLFADIDLPLTASLSFAAAVAQLYVPLLRGRTLHILTRDQVRQPERLLDWYADHPEWGLYCVPTLWDAVLGVAETRMPSRSTPLPGPARVYLTGEATSESLISRSAAVWPHQQYWNLYGPTEAVANATAGPLQPDQPVCLGDPIGQAKLYVLDDDLQPVAAGQSGELWVASTGLAREYVNRPDLTAACFLTNPFHPETHPRLYRTGDRVVQRLDGGLTFVGRSDHQIKVRGFRIEPGEVETWLGRQAGVKRAIVTACEDPQGRKQLVAYWTASDADAPTVADLRRFLARRLPDFMIPSVFIQLDTFPVLASGKVDRSRLPAPDADRPNLACAYEPPESRLEKVLVAIWREILGVDPIGIHDHFFELGGDSLKAAAVISRIWRTLSKKVSYRQFFAHPTPAQLAAILDDCPIETASTDAAEITGLDDGKLASNQRNLWFLDRMTPQLTAYNMQFCIDMQGPLTVAALHNSLNQLIARQDALRTVFPMRADQPIRQILPPFELAPPVIDLRHVSQVQRDHSLRGILAEECMRLFDLSEGPLIRAKLVRLADERHVLGITVHHIVFDGWSIGLFFNELASGYRAGGDSASSERGALKRTYGDLAVWQAQTLAGFKEVDLLAYWKQALAGSQTILEMPTDRPRPSTQQFHGQTLKRLFSREIKARLNAFDREHQVTAFMTLFGVYQMLLYRYSKQADILVGCPVANRAHPDSEAVIGFFVNTIVLRSQLTPDMTFAQLLDQVRDTCLDGFDHQRFPFDKLVDELQPARSTSHNPLFQVMFEYHEALPASVNCDGLDMQVSEPGYETAKFDLTLEIRDLCDGLDVRLNYNSDLYDAATIARYLTQYERLLDGVLRNPKRSIVDYALLNKQDLAQLLIVWNRTERTFAHDQGIHELVAAQVARSPQAVAVEFENQSMTYRTLDRRANQLAGYLRRQGANRHTRIGIYMDSSLERMVSLLAVLKLGGAYIPLDPAFPTDRIAYMIQDAQLPFILSQNHLRANLPPHDARVISVDGQWPIISAERPDQFVSVNGRPLDLAYIMYTSGSTGKPKGVMVPHQGVCNYLQWMQRAFPLTPADAVLNTTTISFDISVWEMFLPLICGARLVLARREVSHDTDYLAQVIQQHQVTQVQFVPSALKMFVDSGRLPTCTGLKRIFSGGEALSTRLQTQVLERFDGELHNLYGPTEASIYMCHYDCRQPSSGQIVPIGKPIFNSKVYILDAKLRPAPIGMVGELFIGGPILATGYLNRPNLTREKFIDHPFSKTPGAKIYRTGDWARYRSDGSIDFLGRIDHQVKVRGYRIELGEIEHKLLDHPEVRETVVIVREDTIDDKRIVAYLVCGPAGCPDNSQLRSWLKRSLPDYMIPAAFVPLEAIPLLPNGKVNRHALPVPKATEAVALKTADLTPDQQVVASIWQRVLGIDGFGVDDNFFDVGGHSLLVIKIQNMIKKHTHQDISVVDLFQHPTVRTLADHIKEKIEYYKTHDDERRAFMQKLTRKINPHD